MITPLYLTRFRFLLRRPLLRRHLSTRFLFAPAPFPQRSQRERARLHFTSTGRFGPGNMRRVEPQDLKQLLSRPGVRLEVGQPFPVGGGQRFMCLAKFIVPRYRVRRIVSEPPPLDDTESTNTMCIVSEEGASPAEARRNLMNRLGDARKLSTLAPSRPRRGWLGRLIKAFA
jgi:hypothetical protein